MRQLRDTRRTEYQIRLITLSSLSCQVPESLKFCSYIARYSSDTVLVSTNRGIARHGACGCPRSSPWHSICRHRNHKLRRLFSRFACPHVTPHSSLNVGTLHSRTWLRATYRCRSCSRVSPRRSRRPSAAVAGPRTISYLQQYRHRQSQELPEAAQPVRLGQSRTVT